MNARSVAAWPDGNEEVTGPTRFSSGARGTAPSDQWLDDEVGNDRRHPVTDAPAQGGAAAPISAGQGQRTSRGGPHRRLLDNVAGPSGTGRPLVVALGEERDQSILSRPFTTSRWRARTSAPRSCTPASWSRCCDSCSRPDRKPATLRRRPGGIANDSRIGVAPPVRHPLQSYERSSESEDDHVQDPPQWSARCYRPPPVMGHRIDQRNWPDDYRREGLDGGREPAQRSTDAALLRHPWRRHGQERMR